MSKTWIKAVGDLSAVPVSNVSLLFDRVHDPGRHCQDSIGCRCLRLFQVIDTVIATYIVVRYMDGICAEVDILLVLESESGNFSGTEKERKALQKALEQMD